MTLFREIDNSLTRQLHTPFDILVRNFFDSETPFHPLESIKLKHPVDVYENDEGLHLEVACVGLEKDEVQINIDRGVLKIVYNKSEEEDNKEDKYYYKGIAKRSFSFGYKVANRFNLSKVEAKMENGLLMINIPHSVTVTKSKSITIN